MLSKICEIHAVLSPPSTSATTTTTATTATTTTGKPTQSRTQQVSGVLASPSKSQSTAAVSSTLSEMNEKLSDLALKWLKKADWQEKKPKVQPLSMLPRFSLFSLNGWCSLNRDVTWLT